MAIAQPASDADFESVSSDRDFESVGAPEPTKEKSPVSIPDEASRVLSSVNKRGIADSLGLPVDLVNKVLKTVGLPMSDKPFGGSESIREGMSALHMTRPEEPETTPGKYAASMGAGATSALLTGGGYGKLAGAAGEALGSVPWKETGKILANPTANAVSGAGAGAGGQAGKDLTAGTPVERAGEFIGSLLGGGLAGAVTPGAGVRPVPPEPNVLRAYERLNLAPSAAEAGVGGRTAQWLEGNVLPQTFGGGNVMEGFARQRQRELTSIKETIANEYGDPLTREGAGKAVQQDVMDAWVTAREKAGKIIGEISDKYGTEPVYAQNFINAVTNPVGAAKSGFVRDVTLDPLVLEARDLIKQNGGVLAFSDLKALMTKYGYALEPGFQKTTNDAQVTQLRQALSKDVEEAVKSRSPEDFAALSKANKQYGKAQEEFKQRFKKLLGTKDVPISAERAYDIVTGAGTETGRADLAEFRSVWRALSKETKGDLAATILTRMGSTDQKFSNDPEKFSVGKFLSAYRNLSSEAKDMLFGATKNKELAQNLDDLAAVASNIQEKISKLASTSKSGAGGIMLGQLGAGSILTGHLLDPMGFMYAIGGPYIAAQILTKPSGVAALSTTLRGVDKAIDAFARTEIDMQSLPKVDDKDWKRPPTEKRSALDPGMQFAMNDSASMSDADPPRVGGQTAAPQDNLVPPVSYGEHKQYRSADPIMAQLGIPQASDAEMAQEARDAAAQRQVRTNTPKFGPDRPDISDLLGRLIIPGYALGEDLYQGEYGDAAIDAVFAAAPYARGIANAIPAPVKSAATKALAGAAGLGGLLGTTGSPSGAADQADFSFIDDPAERKIAQSNWEQIKKYGPDKKLDVIATRNARQEYVKEISDDFRKRSKERGEKEAEADRAAKAAGKEREAAETAYREFEDANRETIGKFTPEQQAQWNALAGADAKQTRKNRQEFLVTEANKGAAEAETRKLAERAFSQRHPEASNALRVAGVVLGVGMPFRTGVFRALDLKKHAREIDKAITDVTKVAQDERRALTVGERQSIEPLLALKAGKIEEAAKLHSFAKRDLVLSPLMPIATNDVIPNMVDVAELGSNPDNPNYKRAHESLNLLNPAAMFEAASPYIPEAVVDLGAGLGLGHLARDVSGAKASAKGSAKFAREFNTKTEDLHQLDKAAANSTVEKRATTAETKLQEIQDKAAETKAKLAESAKKGAETRRQKVEAAKKAEEDAKKAAEAVKKRPVGRTKQQLKGQSSP